MANRFAIALCVLTCWPSAANAEIITGDVQILGFRTNIDDQLAFVNWIDLTAGSSIYFTDSGFFDDGTIRDDEGRLTWTATSYVAAGTVVVITSDRRSSSADLGEADGQVELDQRGDQLFAGTTEFPDAANTQKPGSAYSGQLLAGLDFNGEDTNWDADAVDITTSALPSILGADDLYNVAVPLKIGGQYVGVRAGLTIDEFRSQIDDPNNWARPNSSAALNSTDFAIAAVPEPAGYVFLGLVSLLAFAYQRRKRRLQI